MTYTYGNASSCTLYVDGAEVPGGWTAGNGSDAPASTSGGPVMIGRDGTGTASHGSLYEDISIYSMALSARRSWRCMTVGLRQRLPAQRL